MVERNRSNHQRFHIFLNIMHSKLNILIQNVWLNCFVAILVMNSSCNSATLQFSSSEDRPLALYRAPAPYQESGKARLNSVIITSRPLAIGDQSNGTTTPEPLWRRQLFLSSSTTTPRPRDSTGTPRYSIDCSNGKSCSETFTVESTSVPTFKSYSKDVIDKFLSDYAMSKKTSEKVPNDVTPPTLMKINSTGKKRINENEYKELSDIQNPLDASNRLTNFYLDDEEDADAVSVDAKSRPHWSLINAQQHNHPYDDRDGWVTLEAVPWSSSKISKWQSHNIDNKRPQWTTLQKPSNLWGNRPSSQDWDFEKPSKPIEKPQFSERPYDWKKDRPIKPQYLIGNPPVDYPQQDTTYKPVLHIDRPGIDYGHKPVHQLHQQWITSSHPDIITDPGTENWPISVNRPVGAGTFKPWPIQSDSEHNHHGHQPDETYQYESNRRPVPTPVVYHDGQSQHPHNHPDNGEGEWILLSSTKGYSLPIRHHSYQRALTFNPKPISSTKTVKLTVLPAVNGTANTTTSHGGLLEVESTFQSVDEAQKYEELKRTKNSSNQTGSIKTDYSKMPVRLIPKPARQKGSGRAVLAAVGAGMLPATMALLVPMMLGRRRRSIEQEDENTTITIPFQIPTDEHDIHDTNRRKENKLK